MSVGVKGVYVVPDVVLDKLERSVEEEYKMKQDEQQMEDEQLKPVKLNLVVLTHTLLNCHCHDEQRKTLVKLLFLFRLRSVRWENDACLYNRFHDFTFRAFTRRIIVKDYAIFFSLSSPSDSYLF